MKRILVCWSGRIHRRPSGEAAESRRLLGTRRGPEAPRIRRPSAAMSSSSATCGNPVWFMKS